MARSQRSRRHRGVRETAASGYAPEAERRELTGVLLDTNIIIEFLRGRGPVVDAARSLAAAGGHTYCTAVSWAEVYAGMRPGEEIATEAFFDARGEVLLDRRVGRRAGEYLARYARSHGVEMGDALIAAAAAVSGLRLWTLNRRHYPMHGLHFYEPPAPRRRA